MLSLWPVHIPSMLGRPRLGKVLGGRNAGGVLLDISPVDTLSSSNLSGLQRGGLEEMAQELKHVRGVGPCIVYLGRLEDRPVPGTVVLACRAEVFRAGLFCTLTLLERWIVHIVSTRQTSPAGFCIFRPSMTMAVVLQYMYVDMYMVDAGMVCSRTVLVHFGLGHMGLCHCWRGGPGD